MSYMVGMKDYEGMAGFSGFGQSSSTEVEELQKALTMGYQNPGTSGGGALRAESLEATMRILTFSEEHIRFWRDIPKLPAYSTIEEYTLQRAYGGDVGGFLNEGETPQVQDASYDRKSVLIKYVGVQKEVSHVATLVKPAHGNIIALETRNGALKLLEIMERALFAGRSDTITQSFDGIDQQVRTDSLASSTNIIDCRGGVITEDLVEQATNIIVEAYGRASDLYLAPRALSDVAKQFYPKERIMLPAPVNGTIGLSINAVNTQSGPVALKSNMFLRSGKNNGKKFAPTAGTAPRVPTAPTVSGSAGAVSGSLFATADAGTYQYKVTAINRFGETAGAQESGGVVVVAGDGVTLTISDGGGTDGATGYRIYRSAAGGAAGTEQLIAEVARVGAAATTVFVDINRYLPGCSRAYLVQMNLQCLSFRQLAPMVKMPLATLGPSIRWMQLLYGAPVVYEPRKIVVLDNVLDD